MSSKLLNYPAAASNPHLATGSAAGSSGPGAGSHGSAQLNFENLQLDDILCTVCQSVLVEPVFLPCQHRFCRNCLSGTIEKNNLNCPCCRKRFGTWYRNASRVNKLVHEQLWTAIQSQFRDYLEEESAGVPGAGGRCNGNGSAGSCFVPQSESLIHLSEPGEIRKEYENELQRYRKELIEEKKKELAASEKYIINLYKQEGIIDLVDSSDHLSISSSTSTPEPEKKQKQSQPPPPNSSDVHEVEDDEEAGPSGSSFPQPMAINSIAAGNNQKGNQQQPSNVISSSSNVNASRPETSKSASNGSVISISSTSSASAASSSCISSASSRYSLIKSVAQQIGRGTDMIKQKVQTSILSKLTPGGAKKTFTMADLNKSELCIKPTKLHRRNSSQAAGDDDDDADDGDSLRSELNHFKPIISTTPKSCFSPKAIVRVPSVRPETGQLPSTASTECLSPSKSPFKPIDPTTPRRSAFSVVNVHLFTPPTLSQNPSRQKQLETAAVKKSTPPSASSLSSSKKKKKKNQLKPNVTPLANQRKRKLKFSPKAKAKVKKEALATVSEVPDGGQPLKPSRVTRRSFNREANRLKELIVNDQQRREEMIEQERRDFEFAQKLQKKLNRTRGANVTVTLAAAEQLPKEAPPARSQNNAYSLRRKPFATIRMIDKEVATELVSAGVPAELPSRKRKTMAAPKPVLPPVVEEKVAKGQPKAKKVKLQVTADVPQTTKVAAKVLRRSTRNRH